VNYDHDGAAALALGDRDGTGDLGFVSVAPSPFDEVE